MARGMNVRLSGAPEKVEALAEKIVAQIEEAGQMVVEWSKPYPMKDDPTKVHIYLNIDTNTEVVNEQ